MDNYELKQFEHKLDEHTYPAKLSKAHKRLLSAKLFEIRHTADRRKEEAKQKLATNAEKAIGLKALPVKARPLAKKLTAARTAVASLVKALGELGVVHYENTDHFWVKTPPAEYAALQAAVSKQLETIEAERKEACQQTYDVAQSLAKAQIDELKAKIAKANPQIVAKLDAIGQQKALPPAVVEVKQIDGKKQTQAQAAKVRKLVVDARRIEYNTDTADLPSIISSVKKLDKILTEIQSLGDTGAEVDAIIRGLRTKAVEVV
jgi:hypothetical protein